MFGDRLRRLRGTRSQREVAEALDIPVTTLSTLENQQSVPRGDVVQRLADHFKVPVHYFYRSEASQLRTSDAAQAAALAWLEQIRQPAKGKDTIAAQSNIDLDDSTKERIAEKLREKSAQVSGRN